jgi:hypothetical protein
MVSSDIDVLLQSRRRRDLKLKAPIHNSDAASISQRQSRSRTNSTSANTVALMRQVLDLQDDYDFSIVLSQAEKLKPGIIEWVTVYLQSRLPPISQGL